MYAPENFLDIHVSPLTKTKVQEPKATLAQGLRMRPLPDLHDKGIPFGGPRVRQVGSPAQTAIRSVPAGCLGLRSSDHSGRESALRNSWAD
jgi:hypothetical protein